MNNPLVSICIPAYNHEGYVQTCIKSVIAQDYKNIELLIVDDGSSDGTWEKIGELQAACAARFVRIEFRRRSNRGRPQTFRELLSMARGEYIGEIASDDAYLPGAITAMVNFLSAHHEYGLVVGVNEIMDSAGNRCYWTVGRLIADENKAAYKTLDEWIEQNCGVNLDGIEFGTYQSLLKANHVPNGYLKRRDLIGQIEPYCDNAPLEDWWFHLQFSKVTRYKHLDVATFRYRWHKGNSSHGLRRLMMEERATLKQERKVSSDVRLPFRAWVILYVPISFRMVLAKFKRRIR